MERSKAPTAMKHIRIGKDISIRWEITTDGAAIPLEGRDLTLEIKSPIGKVIILPYRLDGNILTMTYYGYEQTVVGEYSLTLWENKGKHGQNVVDAIRAFKLVRTSPEEEDFAGGDLQVESVDLGTANLEILSGGGASTPGGDSEAIAQINSTLQEIKTQQTEQNSTLADHEERLVYTEGDLVKVREEYDGIISELVKSIAHTQKAFVIETNDSDGYIYIDSAKKIIPANTIKAFRFNSVFTSGSYANSGIKSFLFLVTDTSEVTSMNDMFARCSALTSLDLSNFDTSAVTKMYSMFSGCSALTSLDLSNFDTSAVKAMAYMFSGCSALTSLDVSNFYTSSVTDMRNMFSGCSALTSLDVSNFDTSSVTDMRNMFSGCSALTSLDVSNFDTSAVKEMMYMFDACSSLTSLDLSNFDTSKVTNMNNMFSDCSALTSLDVSNFDTSKVTNMNDMFARCSALTSLDLSNFDTSAVTKMYSMFSGCSALTSLDLSNFDTSAVKAMAYMFSGCSALTSLDVSNFYTSEVTYMNNMFAGCSALTSLDVSNFDTSAVTDMNYMFYGCSSLTSLLLGPNFFKTSAVKNIDFSSCSKWTNETVVTSLVTNSYDRAAAGLNTLTIRLHANTKAALTDEQKATITNKGYTIA